MQAILDGMSEMKIVKKKKLDLKTGEVNSKLKHFLSFPDRQKDNLKI